MRIPRPRFSLRGLMIAVAIQAVAMGGVAIYHRWQDYRCRSLVYAEFERDEAASLDDGRTGLCGLYRMSLSAEDRRAAVASYRQYRLEITAYYRSMRRKYEYAAAHPWIIVEPDPPFPE